MAKRIAAAEDRKSPGAKPGKESVQAMIGLREDTTYAIL